MAYLWPFSIPDWVNATPYQRPLRLSERFEVILFLPRGAEVPEAIRNRVRVVTVGTRCRPSWNRRLFALHVGRSVRRLHRERPFDLLYSSHFLEAAAARRLARSLKLPWVADLHDHPGLSRALAAAGGARWKAAAHALWERAQGAFLRRADLVVCGVEPGAVSALRIPRSRRLHVTNGVDLERTRPRPPRAGTGRGRPGEAKLFYVGYVSEARGAFTLLHAAAALSRPGRAVRLCLAGPCDERTRSRLAAEAGGTPGLALDLPGPVPHHRVLDLASESDACVFPFPPRPELLINPSRRSSPLRRSACLA